MGGACMSLAAAVAAWKEHMEPQKSLKEKMYLGSPAVTNGPSGLTYLSYFMTACTGCTIDFINVHWYVPPPIHLTSLTGTGMMTRPTRPTSRSTLRTRARSLPGVLSGSQNFVPEGATTRSRRSWTRCCRGSMRQATCIAMLILWRTRSMAI